MSTQATQQPTSSRPDCLACRLTGAATFGGVGTYALYLAHRDGAFDRIRRPGGARVAPKLQAVIGVGFLGVAVVRLLV